MLHISVYRYCFLVRLFATRSELAPLWSICNVKQVVFNVVNTNLIRLATLVAGHFNYDNFDPDAYDEMDKLEKGDCTWIVPGKLMAFSGPQNNRKEISEIKR